MPSTTLSLAFPPRRRRARWLPRAPLSTSVVTRELARVLAVADFFDFVGSRHRSAHGLHASRRLENSVVSSSFAGSTKRWYELRSMLRVLGLIGTKRMRSISAKRRAWGALPAGVLDVDEEEEEEAEDLRAFFLSGDSAILFPAAPCRAGQPRALPVCVGPWGGGGGGGEGRSTRLSASPQY